MDRDTSQQTHESVRKTYDQLIKTRNTQLKYMASARKGKEVEFAFLLSPDIVLQYNYVHQLMKSFRSGIPADICVEDGGIMCSNLSVLQKEKTEGGITTSLLEKTDGSDYVASRIVDLLNRPVTIGDQDLTLNVRDEFAANIRTLNMLFEERYRICQEQGNRLKDELATVKTQLAASRVANSEIDLRKKSDQTLRRLTEQMTNYETQCRIARQELERFTETNDQLMEQNQRTLESLIGHMSSYGHTNYGEDFLRLFNKLFEILESERERIRITVDHLQSVDERRSTDFSQLMATERSGERKALEQLAQQEVSAHVQRELAAHLQEIDSRVEAEVDSRTKEEEFRVSLKHMEQLEKEFDELRKEFDERLKNDLEVKMATVQQIHVSDEAGMAIKRAIKEARVREGLVKFQDDLIQFKSDLDTIFQLKEGPEPVPILPRYEIPRDLISKDGAAQFTPNKLTNEIYKHLGYLLEKMNDLYRSLIKRNRYLNSIDNIAIRENVPIKSMTRERTKNFINQIKQITNGQANNSVLEMLERVSGELPQLKTYVDSFYNDMNFYSTNSKLIDEKLNELYALEECMNDGEADGGPLTSGEIAELKSLEFHCKNDRRVIDSLRKKLTDFNKDEMVNTNVAKGQLRAQYSLNRDLLIKFRAVYDDLSTYIINVLTDYEKWFFVNGLQKPSFTHRFKSDFNNMLSIADGKINYGSSYKMGDDSPRTLSKGATKRNV